MILAFALEASLQCFAGFDENTSGFQTIDHRACGARISIFRHLGRRTILLVLNLCAVDFRSSCGQSVTQN